MKAKQEPKVSAEARELRMAAALRKSQLCLQLIQNQAYNELIERPCEEDAKTSFVKASTEARKPAGLRNDALVVEHFRHFLLLEEIGTSVRNRAKAFQKQEAEKERAAKEP